MSRNPPVASIHTSFNINRNIHEAHTGPITLQEQIKAMERFVRWHTRALEVGKQLLGRLMAEQEAETKAAADIEDPVTAEETELESPVTIP